MIREKNMLLNEMSDNGSVKKGVDSMLGTILTILGALASVAGGILTASSNNEKQSTMIADKVVRNLKK